ncbi:hypothetical protein AB0L53_18885 [Nonomuraea sp. NPDC052129]|uniref:hypothetical protein n=1 Tax=Nonomuraea sp. NPDC052129 TaxID=3154651 RepID=UPI003418933F
MRSVILGGTAAALLLASATPALAAPDKPLTSAQLSEALITPEDLGDAYAPNPKHIREALDADSAHTKKCLRAMRALKPLLSSPAAVYIDKEGLPSGVKQFAISGTPAKMAAWQTVGKVMVRDCAGTKTKTKRAKSTTTRLSIGTVGNWVYGIRYKETMATRSAELQAADVVLIRVKNAVTLLVSDGFFGAFEPGLSKRAARLAVPKLRDAQNE